MHEFLALSTENGWLAFLGPNKRDSLQGEETKRPSYDYYGYI